MNLIAENITVTHPTIARAIAARDPLPILSVVELANRAGAGSLDLNLGPSRRGGVEALGFLLELLGTVWDKGIWIDTTDVELMAQAVECWPHAVTLNGYSGGGDREGIARLAASTGMELVIFLMHGATVPVMAEERLALAAELMGHLAEVGVEQQNVVIDPVLAPLGWMDGQRMNGELIKVLKALPGLFGEEVRTVIGLSNLVTGSTGQKRVKWLEGAFVSMAAGAGLTHVLCDISDNGVTAAVKAVDVFSDRRPFAPSEFSR